MTIKNSCKYYKISRLIFLTIIIPKFMIIRQSGSGAVSCKMLLVRIVENDTIDVYFRAG